MARPLVAALTILLTTTLLAGCLDNEAGVPDAQTLEATGGMVSAGYAYDGSGVMDGNARLSGWVDHLQNTGQVEATFEYAGSTWQVVHDSFSGSEEWKEGGISFGLVEHGDTGISTPIIPRIDGQVVTYGTATVLRDGEPAGDPGGEEGPWAAHLMLASNTIRDGQGRITKSDGTTPYDPASPGDATIAENDPQGFLQLIAPSGPDSARATEAINATVEVMGPDFSQALELGGGKGASIALNITAGAGENPVQAGNLELRLVSDGNELATAAGDILPGQPFAASMSAEGLNSTAVLEITGNGTFEVQVEGSVRFDDHPFLVITWDDYQLDVHEGSATE